MTDALPRVMTFLLAGGNGTRLWPLTHNTPKPLVPFAGLFRMIDITLSNCWNSKLDEVYVLTQQHSGFIGNHLSQVWNEGVQPRFAVPLPPAKGKRYQGTADAVLQNIDLIETNEPDVVLILSADHVYRMDYDAIILRHIQRAAELTVSVVEVPVAESNGLGIVRIDREQRITSFEEKPAVPGKTSSGRVWANQGVYVFNADILMRTARKVNHDWRCDDFGGDVIPSFIHSIRCFAHCFQERSTGKAGYWYDLGTISNYHQAHMDLLRRNPPFDLYEAAWPICRANQFQNSILHEMRRDPEIASIIPRDALIRGDSIRCSVLSDRVTVQSGADVRASVLLSGVRIGRGAAIRRAVIAEGVEIAAGDVIGYDPELDRPRFLVTDNGIVVVGEGSQQPAATGRAVETARHG